MMILETLIAMHSDIEETSHIRSYIPPLVYQITFGQASIPCCALSTFSCAVWFITETTSYLYSDRLVTASSSKKQARTNESHDTKPINMNTHFSLKGNPKPDVMDHENRLPATVGDIALKIISK